MILIIIALMFLYTFGAGAVGKQVHALGQNKCKNKQHDWEHCGHYYTGILSGAFWPLALPIAAGMRSSEELPTPVNKELRADKARQDELKRVNHEAQLEQAELMKEEMLDRRLELGVKRMELEHKRLELTARGVPDFVEDDAPKKSRRQMGYS